MSERVLGNGDRDWQKRKLLRRDLKFLTWGGERGEKRERERREREQRERGNREREGTEREGTEREGTERGGIK